MRSRHRIILAAVVLLAAIVLSRAHAQGYRIGNWIIPESSIERPGDIGVRAHTYLHILAGPDGKPFSDGLPGFGPDGGLGPADGFDPTQLRQAYDLPATGGSQIIAIVDAYDDPNALADFNTFSAQFGLPQETSANAMASATNKVFQVLYGNGSKPTTDGTGSWEAEKSLDIEWAHAMAPNAKIILVEALDTSFNNLLAAEDAATSYTDANGLKVKEVSNSWGSGEFSGETRFDSHFLSGNVAYFFSSGDSGAPAEYPTASPYVVSVGGTTVNTDGNGNFTSEVGWSLGPQGAGGGGPSVYEARPAFQNGIVAIVGAARGTPDISSAATPSASIYDSFPFNGTVYGWLHVGGTSWSSPSLAGIANLAATAAGAFPAGSQALLTTIYSNLGTANFRDIISGNNGYPALVGWDFVSGVGSCLGLAGLQATAGPPPLTITSLSPSSANAGGASFTLTVNGSGFVNGSTVDWNGTALATTYVSRTQVTATVPAGDIASAGTANVTVVNPGPVTSNAATFTINNSLNNPKPVLTAISPNSATHGSGQLTITCTGNNFIPGSVVKWYFNGRLTTLTTTYLSPTMLTGLVPSSLLSSAGTAYVLVFNPAPGGGYAIDKSFTIK